MKKKYGFTLVELLVVIVIVGILLLIAVPSVSKYLKRGTKEYYSNLENTVMLAGRDYFNDYRTLLPRAVDNVTVIQLDELVENKYIDKVVDKNGDKCTGRIIAKKIRKSEYEYYTCLICEDYKDEEEIEACSYDENQNVTLDTKYYRIDVEKDYYEVNQGENFTLPYGKAYYTKNGKEELINDRVEGKPKTIDTNKLGTTTVTYYYKGAKKEIMVNVKDVVKPSAPEIVLKYDNANGKVYKEGTWSNSNIYAEFKSTDYTKSGVVGSGISRYEISEDNKVTYNYLNSNNKLHEVDQNKTYYVRSMDKANNISESNEYMIMIDRNSPSCSITADGSKTSENNQWYTGNVSLTLNPTDNLSGVAISSMVVKKNNSVVQVTNNTITENGIYTVEGSAIDNAGNLSTCSITVKIDQTAPNAPTLAISDGINSGNWHKADFTITAGGASNISGNTYYYGTSTNPTTKGTVQSVSSNTSSTTYYFKVCSGAGICSTTSSYVAKLDKTIPDAPTLTISDNITSGNWHKADFTITAGGANNISSNTYYYGTSTNPTTKGTVQSVSSNTSSTTYYFKVCSGVGLCSTTSSYVAKLDKTIPDAPTIVAGDSITSGNWHKVKTTLTAKNSEALSGITYYLGADKTKVEGKDSAVERSWVTRIDNTSASGKTYYAMACNGVGTCSNVSSYVLKLDKTAPEVSVTVSDSTATFTFKDNIGVVGYGVNKSSTTPPTYTSITSTTSTTQAYNTTEDGTYYVWVKDAAGNNSNVKFEIKSNVCAAADFTGTYTHTNVRDGYCNNSDSKPKLTLGNRDITNCKTVTFDVQVSSISAPGNLGTWCTCGTPQTTCYCGMSFNFMVGENSKTTLLSVGRKNLLWNGQSNYSSYYYTGKLASGNDLEDGKDSYTKDKITVTVNISSLSGTQSIYTVFNGSCWGGTNTFVISNVRFK